MKKYIQPAIEVTEVETEALMAASGINETPIDDPVIDDATEILSREQENFSVWDN